MLQIISLRSIALSGALAASLVLATNTSLAQTKGTSTSTPVLVELFTAEGCSSCPPADNLLAQLESQQPVPGADIIVLGEHVDYWDQSGWRDRFDSPQFTERQHGYGFRLTVNDIYTPQMIVDGTEQFVGNDTTHALNAISHAAQAIKVPLVLAKPEINKHSVIINVSLASPSTTLPKADLYAALVDPTDTTNVGGGENRGRTLHHVAVVRVLQRIGKLKNLESGPLKANLSTPEGTMPAKMRVVVFAQMPGPGAVVGAIQMPVTQ
ncbi:MAG TPA: DUF1223 domain-containing protein [Edaphobacter sp.]|nr:DUF1223 domain-containing protein [Edaphobacter sp.]